MSIFHQHNHPTIKYCSSIILSSVLKLGYLQQGIGASPILYRINTSTKQLLKKNKLAFKMFSGKFQKPLISQNNLCRPALQSVVYPLQPRHILNASRHYLSIQSVSMSTALFVILFTLLLAFTCIFFIVHFLLTRHLPRHHSISCCLHDLERTINKPFTGLIGLRHATSSRAVTHQI